MKKNKKGRPFGAPQVLIKPPAIHALLTEGQIEDLRKGLAEIGFGISKDLKDPSRSKDLRSAIKKSGFFRVVSAIPGSTGVFSVILKGSGKVAQGSFGFALPADG